VFPGRGAQGFQPEHSLDYVRIEKPSTRSRSTATPGSTRSRAGNRSNNRVQSLIHCLIRRQAPCKRFGAVRRMTRGIPCRSSAISPEPVPDCDPGAYKTLCLRLAHLVRPATQHGSAMDPRLDTGGWLALTRRGLSPRKMRRALPGAITPAMSRAGATAPASRSMALLCVITFSYEVNDVCRTGNPEAFEAIRQSLDLVTTDTAMALKMPGGIVKIGRNYL